MKTRKRNIFLLQILLFVSAILLIYFTYYQKDKPINNDLSGLLDKQDSIIEMSVNDKIIKDLGNHPTDNQPVIILEGQYGPYIKHKSLNAKVPEGKDPNKITKKEAITILEKNKEIEKVNIENDELDNKSKFSNVEYKGMDLNGNRYILKSKKAEFAKEKPELVYMNDVNAIFYFKDGTTLRVSSKKGIYNNKTNDMQFKQDVSSKYLENFLTSENLDFFNTNNLLEVYGNVKVTSNEGKVLADKLRINILNKTLDITMNKENLVDVSIYK